MGFVVHWISTEQLAALECITAVTPCAMQDVSCNSAKTIVLVGVAVGTTAALRVVTSNVSSPSTTATFAAGVFSCTPESTRDSGSAKLDGSAVVVVTPFVELKPEVAHRRWRLPPLVAVHCG